MAVCRRCGRGAAGEDGFCEPCSDFVEQLHRETDEIACEHCGRSFLPSAFDRHRWNVYHRRGFPPKGRKIGRR